MPTIDNNAWIILAGTLFGGAGLKVVEYLLSKKKKKDDDATQIRSELRDEVVALREQLVQARIIEQNLEDEVEEWRSKFYDLRDDKIKSDTNLTIANERIRTLEELTTSLRGTIGNLEASMTRLEEKIAQSN